jgi:hypothetical protein
MPLPVLTSPERHLVAATVALVCIAFRFIRPVPEFPLALALHHAPAPTQEAPARWHLSARPTVTIGREGDPHAEFLRVGRVIRLPGGEILVPNAGTNEIRVFDRSGRYLRAIGRSGAGPGEFRLPSLVARAGDTLFVADPVNARISEILASGRLVKTIPITARSAATGYDVVGRFRDGRWAVVTKTSPNIYGPERRYRDSAQVGLLAPDASGGVVWIGSYPGVTLIVHKPGNGPHGDVVGVVPLAPTAVSAVSGDEVLIGDTGANMIGAYSSAGAKLRLIQLPLTARPLTDVRIAQTLKQAVEENPSARSRPYLTALHSRAVMGSTLPVFRSMVPTADGALWVEPFPADAAAPTDWLVLDSAGHQRASVMVPGGFEITEVGPDYVVGIHTDGSGVETIRLYGLIPR